jgi:hypothetical protein
MEFTNQRTIALIIALGSLCFLIAAFLPVSKVYMEQSAEKKLEIMQNMKMQWDTGQVLFGLGSVITVIGLGILVLARREVSLVGLAYTGIGIMLIGSALWSWHVVERIVSPEGFASGNNTPYLFVIYSILTQFGLILLGIFLLNTEIKKWVGVMFIAGGAVLFLLMVVFKDMPPFAYYILTMIAAVVIYLKQPFSTLGYADIT